MFDNNNFDNKFFTEKKINNNKNYSNQFYRNNLHFNKQNNSYLRNNYNNYNNNLYKRANNNIIISNNNIQNSMLSYNNNISNIVHQNNFNHQNRFDFQPLNYQTTNYISQVNKGEVMNQMLKKRNSDSCNISNAETNNSLNNIGCTITPFKETNATFNLTNLRKDLVTDQVIYKEYKSESNKDNKLRNLKFSNNVEIYMKKNYNSQQNINMIVGSFNVNKKSQKFISKNSSLKKLVKQLNSNSSKKCIKKDKKAFSLRNQVLEQCNNSILEIDVQLASENKKIILKSGDDVQQIAKNFCLENSLSNDLMDAISSKIQFAVSSIDKMFNFNLSLENRKYLKEIQVNYAVNDNMSTTSREIIDSEISEDSLIEQQTELDISSISNIDEDFINLTSNINEHMNKTF